MESNSTISRQFSLLSDAEEKKNQVQSSSSKISRDLSFRLSFSFFSSFSFFLFLARYKGKRY